MYNKKGLNKLWHVTLQCVIIIITKLKNIIWKNVL